MDADGAEDAAGTLPDGAPGYEFRLETAKLLLDLDDSTEAAVRVLEGLIEERDTVPDAWFLLALAHHGACKFKRARENLDHAEEARGSPAAALGSKHRQPLCGFCNCSLRWMHASDGGDRALC